jgi:hypothetical protein
MVANISYNPYITTVGQGLFQVQSKGYVQGDAMPDPMTRNARRTAQLDINETIPMWGGVGIYEHVPGGAVASTPNQALGPIVGRANGLTGAKGLQGFSSFDGAYASVVSVQSTVPMIGSFGQVMTYALGSRARIAVACDPSLTSLSTGSIAAQVAWDFVNQLLVPFTGTLTITSGTYVSGTGLTTLTMSAPVAFSPGDAIVLSALTGTGAFASLNGTFTAIGPTSGTTVSFLAPSGLGAATITGGSLVLGSGASVALPADVIDLQIGNCMTVNYNSVTNTASWNFNGSCALIQI